MCILRQKFEELLSKAEKIITHQGTIYNLDITLEQIAHFVNTYCDEYYSKITFKASDVHKNNPFLDIYPYGDGDLYERGFIHDILLHANYPTNSYSINDNIEL